MSIGTEKLYGEPGEGTSHLLIIGDGFHTSEDMSLFVTTTNAVVAEFSGFLGALGVSQATSRLCLWRAKLTTPKYSKRIAFPCTDDGVSRGVISGSRTRFDTAFSPNSTGQCTVLQGDYEAVWDMIFLEKFDLPQDVHPSGVLVLVNTTKFGGSEECGVVWASLVKESYISLSLHELGHLMGLEDEYESSCTISDPDSVTKICSPNVSSDAVSPRWSSYLSANNLVKKKINDHCRISPSAPNPLPTVGMFQGAYYKHRRYYRPSEHCLMRELSSQTGFCTVCKDFLRGQFDSTFRSGLKVSCG